jgi:hypothetical protein
MKLNTLIALGTLVFSGIFSPAANAQATGWTANRYVGSFWSYQDTMHVRASSSPSTNVETPWGSRPAEPATSCPNITFMYWPMSNPNAKTWINQIMMAKALGLTVRFRYTCPASIGALNNLNQDYALIDYLVVDHNF